MNRTFRSLALAAIVAVLAACGSSVKLDEEQTAAPIEDRSAAAQAGAAAAGSGADASGAGSRQVTPVTVGTTDPLNDPASPLAKRSIYFDFDSFTIKDEYRGVVEAHARYLVANKGRRVVIQGNTDERGSREYNLALGQKRAEAVRKALVALGVADSQLEAVSFGEEKPRAAGSDEASWAENRRADLAYQ
jgi:peptidoglycan-associated lipoprotein